MRIFLTGATGFVGTHLRHALVRDGHEVVGYARSVPVAEDGVQWVAGEIGDLETLTEAMNGCDAVIHLAAIIRETGDATFVRVHVQGAEHVLAAMRHAKIARLLHMSALGAGPKQPTEYYRTKWVAEELVRATGLDYTIFRPSLIFGPGDGFISTIADQVRWYPVIPIIGSGSYPFAPIAIEAVVEAYLQALALNGSTAAKTFELCGPETLTYAQIVNLVAEQLRVRKLRVHLPVGFLRFGIALGRLVHLPLPITDDQLAMLLLGNICTEHTAVQVFDLPRITLAEGIRAYLHPRQR